MDSDSTPNETKKSSADSPAEAPAEASAIDVSALMDNGNNAPAAAAVQAQAEVVAQRAARRFEKRDHYPAKGIRKGALRRLIFKAATPFVRMRKGKARHVAPRIGQGAEDLLRTLLSMVMAELSEKAAVVAQHGKRKTLYTRDVCYAARVMLGHNVF